MTVNTGIKHTYCGMTLVFNNNRTVTIDMVDYLKEAITKFGEDCNKTVKSPVAMHLFETNDDQTKLNDKDKTLFHRIVAILLFVGLRGRPDILIAVASSGGSMLPM